MCDTHCKKNNKFYPSSVTLRHNILTFSFIRCDRCHASNRHNCHVITKA